MSGIRGERYIDENGNEVLTGGLKAAVTNKERYGDGFYANIGAKGGRTLGVKKGFAANPALARVAGRKAGSISKRGFKYLGTEGAYRKYLDKNTGKVVKYPV